MRELTCDDLFALSEIADVMNIQPAAASGTPEEVGMELLLQLGKKVHLARGQVLAFLGSLNDKTPEEMAKMRAVEVIKMFKDLLGSEEIIGFFK